MCCFSRRFITRMFRGVYKCTCGKGGHLSENVPWEEKVKAHQKMVNYIEAFCNKMTEKYLMPAASRHYKRRKSLGAKVVKVNPVYRTESVVPE